MPARDYDTLSEAVDALQKAGYTYDFQMKFDCLSCQEDQKAYHPADFEIVDVYRFEGMTNPGDSSVVYSIEAKDGRKGLLIDAYGAYADPISTEMIEKLQIRRRNR